MNKIISATKAAKRRMQPFDVWVVTDDNGYSVVHDSRRSARYAKRTFLVTEYRGFNKRKWRVVKCRVIEL